MKKFIAAFDGFDLSNAALQYAIQFSKSAHAHLVGIFLDDFTYHRYRFSDVLDEEGGLSDRKLMAFDKDDEQARDASVDMFEKACQHEGITYTTHRDRNIALQELLHESIYSDLLIIDKKEGFNRFDKETPTQFLRDLLADVQCPVLVVPHHYKPIDKTVLLYDGEPSSVFAVKMFSYLLPTMKSERIEVLTIRDEKNRLQVPDAKLIKEFMKRHYPLADFIVEKGEAEDVILDYLQTQSQNLLVVLGAYQRSRVSRWFKPSMADRLLIHLNVPLFIAHNK
jgi:nucleotide-binding universal stress UspA family protein